MAISINYGALLVSAVSNNVSVKDLNTKFRPGGKENKVKAMNAIIEELKDVDDPDAKAVLNMAKAVLVHDEKGQVTGLPWWKMGQGQVKMPQTVSPPVSNPVSPPVVVSRPVTSPAPKVASLDGDVPQTPQEEVKNAMVVVPQFMDSTGIYRVTREEDGNIRLESLSQGRWSLVMSSKWYKTTIVRINLLNKAMEKFGDKKVQQFTAGEVLFTYYGSSKNPCIKNSKGKVFISKAQAENWYAPKIAAFMAVPACVAAVK